MSLKERSLDDVRYQRETDASDETQSPVEHERIEPSELDEYIGEDFTIAQETEEMSESHPDQPMRVGEDKELIFDSEASRRAELAVIDEYLQCIESGEDLGYYFRDESPAFIQNIFKPYLEQRKKELQGGSADQESPSSKIDNAAYGNSIKRQARRAAEIITSLSQKEMMREALENQIDFLPIKTVETKTKGTRPFDKPTLFDENAPIGDPGDLDWIFASGKDGEPELIVSSQHAIEELLLKPPTTFDEKTNTFITPNKFSLTLLPSADGKEEILFQVRQGNASRSPIFARIRFVKQALSLDEEIKQYQKEKERARQDSYQSSSPRASSPSSSSRGSSSSRSSRRPSSSFTSTG